MPLLSNFVCAKSFEVLPRHNLLNKTFEIFLRRTSKFSSKNFEVFFEVFSLKNCKTHELPSKKKTKPSVYSNDSNLCQTIRTIRTFPDPHTYALLMSMYKKIIMYSELYVFEWACIIFIHNLRILVSKCKCRSV